MVPTGATIATLTASNATSATIDAKVAIVGTGSAIVSHASISACHRFDAVPVHG